MARSALGSALLGFAGGALVAVVALPLELAARGLPLRGGLGALQTQSVAIWVVEALPLLLGVAMYAIASRGEPNSGPAAAPPAPPAPLPAPPLPSPRADGPVVAPPPPPPLPPQLATSSVLQAGGDAKVTALQELLRQVREQADRVERESREKSRTVAQMANELRAPLATIIGHAELLEEEGKDLGEARLADVRHVVRNARQLSGLVNEILDLAKLELGTIAMVLEDVDLAQVLDEVRVVVNPLAERNQNRFVGRVVPGARFGRGDHMRVRQVIVGLVGHAFRLLREATVSATIERHPRQEGAVVVRIRDTGPGLSPEEVRRLLEGTAGAALTVSIGRRLTELMGGVLEVESTPGRGTTFSLVLAPASRQESEVAPRSTIALNERLAGMRLLVVDGEASGSTLQRYFERAGMEVRRVPDVLQAHQAFEKRDAQLVLVDVGLQGGWDLVEALVARRVRVVANSHRDEDVERALESGVTAFLTRPLERRLALATLERCLD